MSTILFMCVKITCTDIQLDNVISRKQLIIIFIAGHLNFKIRSNINYIRFFQNCCGFIFGYSIKIRTTFITFALNIKEA